MADDELEAIRRQRMAELQAKHGDSSNNQQAEEAKQRETDMRNSILAQVLDQSARARLSNLALVKPEKANAVENYLIQMARFGKLGGKISESGLIEILEKVSQQTDKKTTVTLKTTTTVATSRSFQEDRIWLNGKEEDINHPRLQSCLREIRRLARKRRNDGGPGVDSTGLSHKVHICSVNNFPTAAGLASSAAGFACLVYTLAQVYGVEGELSGIARQGSGSACRSMYGGFVQWIMGQKDDGKDSLAQQVEPETHWPELRILVLVHRAESVVPSRMVEMTEAVRRKDFAAFAELTMKDSNQFHATCLDTYPPIFYLNSVSQQVISLVHRFNRHYGETRVAYTFDAGPNAVIFTLQQHVPEFAQVVQHFFPPETNGGQFIKGLPVDHAALSEELKQTIGLEPIPKGISYIISTKVGPGPCAVQDLAQHLLGSDGLPKTTV
ncbi:hypothetical protein L3Q82_000307 [Scortum barcoo]|uniref:Uncharacterized protein n=1 Tax=Scortum barcoo TaxID=214431 RepID=A0ACB8XE27_9TELE|nr:hypothetical protein L3Q82_000307 [Scortum barcoo]